MIADQEMINAKLSILTASRLLKNLHLRYDSEVTKRKIDYG